MPVLDSHGISINMVAGWDGEIYLPSPAVSVPSGPTAGAGDLRAAALKPVVPIVHLANVALFPGRGDYGGGAVESLGADGVFIALLEHPTSELGSALFQNAGLPWPLAPEDFSRFTLQRRIGGQAGCQRFFSVDGRAFCLYAVIGSYAARASLVQSVNRVLATVRITA